MTAPPLQNGRRVLVCGVLAAAGAIAMGCGEEKTAEVKLDVIFPSTEMAIASDEVKFVVYDDPTPGACQRIYLKRITNQTDLPAVVLDPPSVSVCQLAFGRAPPLRLPLGKHSILAVAIRSNEDLMVGCSDVAISDEVNEVVVNLTLPGTTPIPPPTTCSTLRDFCSEVCD